MIPRLTHPGPVALRRWAVQPCQAEPVEVTLPVADSLAQSAALALALSAYDGGWLVIENAALAALDFVLPGVDPSGAHAAWYAGPYRMGTGQIEHLGLHVGHKEGAPWLHGHGRFSAPGWTGPTFGHILPLDSRLAQPSVARGWGIRGAQWQVQADAETHFPLFQPIDTGGGGNAALVTLRPNQDICTALTTAAHEAGIPRARIFGLGSLVHPRLTGHPPINSFATEILLTAGSLNGTGRLEAQIVTLDGSLHQGWLEPGANSICITAELLLIAD